MQTAQQNSQYDIVDQGNPGNRGDFEKKLFCVYWGM